VAETHSIAGAVSYVKSYALHSLEPWGLPLEFPTSTVIPTVLPGPRYGHRIEDKTIAETWSIHRIKTTGTIRPLATMGNGRVSDLMAIVTEEPDGFYFPEPNYLPCDRAFIKSLSRKS